MGQALRRAVGRASVDAASPDLRPPKLRPPDVIKPRSEPVAELDGKDPKYQTLVHQLVGTITSRIGEAQEAGEERAASHTARPLPKQRHTAAVSGPDERAIVKPGTLNVAQLTQLFLMHDQKSEGADKSVEVEVLANKFNVDPVLLRRVLKHHRLSSSAQRQALLAKALGQEEEVNSRQVFANGA